MILTDVGPWGIAMAADTAVTEQWENQARVLHGVTKLFRHESSRSGLAIWGESLLPNPVPQQYPVPMGFAVAKLLSISADCTEPHHLAERLAHWLNITFPKPRRWAGIDIGAMIRLDQGFVPVVLRVSNATSADTAVGSFRTSVLRKPGAYDPMTDVLPIPAGDLNAIVWIDELNAAIRHGFSRTNEPFPAANLDERRQYLAVITRAVSDIYATMGIGRSIGGSVLTLGIRSSDGLVSSVEPSEHGGAITTALAPAG